MVRVYIVCWSLNGNMCETMWERKSHYFHYFILHSTELSCVDNSSVDDNRSSKWSLIPSSYNQNDLETLVSCIFSLCHVRHSVAHFHLFIRSVSKALYKFLTNNIHYSHSMNVYMSSQFEVTTYTQAYLSTIMVNMN